MSVPAQSNMHYEHRARLWDRWVTVVIIVMLLMPLPFVRFEAWSNGRVISEHIVMPWSRFRLCYTSFPDGEPVELPYGFTWKGELLPRDTLRPLLSDAVPASAPLLKWESKPEIALDELFREGDFLRVESFWSPVLLWPFGMGWQLNGR